MEVRYSQRNSKYVWNFNYPYKTVKKAYSEIIGEIRKIPRTSGYSFENFQKRTAIVFQLYNEKILQKLNVEIVIPSYIPAGRSFFANLDGNVFAFLSSGSHLDFFIREFGREYKETRRNQLLPPIPRKTGDGKISDVDPRKISQTIIEKIICGKHIVEKKENIFCTRTA